mmetsp:Transcript_7464/g.13466  ORF Transcript_7464/g.13466 Transcript_7464/m.13466 type:complete len:230 (-) Transcript_7464:384-1073(-)
MPRSGGHAMLKCMQVLSKIRKKRQSSAGQRVTMQKELRGVSMHRMQQLYPGMSQSAAMPTKRAARPILEQPKMLRGVLRREPNDMSNAAWLVLHLRQRQRKRWKGRQLRLLEALHCRQESAGTKRKKWQLPEHATLHGRKPRHQFHKMFFKKYFALVDVRPMTHHMSVRQSQDMGRSITGSFGGCQCIEGAIRVVELRYFPHNFHLKLPLGNVWYLIVMLHASHTLFVI